MAEVRAEHEPAYAGSPAGPDATKPGASASGREKAGRASESGTEQKEPKEEGRTEESSPRAKRTQPQ
jgi:hypothetical protein